MYQNRVLSWQWQIFLLLLYLSLEIRPILCEKEEPKSTTIHPLTPLTEIEMELVAEFVISKNPDKQCVFILINLLEPPKKLLAPYLRKYYNRDLALTDVIPHVIPRKAFVVFIDLRSTRSFESIVELSTIVPIQVFFKKLPVGFQPHLVQSFDLENIDYAILNSKEVSQRAKELGFNNTDLITVTSTGLIRGNMGRVIQLFAYFREFAGDNPFAHPLPFSATVDIFARKVVETEDLPIFANFSAPRQIGIKLPHKIDNYYPPLLPPDFFRKDVKPVKVESVGGSSITITDTYNVAWQKFKFRIGYQIREGVIIYDVSFQDGNKQRPLFYKLSIPDISVPYGDARAQYRQKFYYDFGDIGQMQTSQPQQLGVDCLHTGYLIDAIVNDIHGQPVKIPGAICIFEEDGGVLHKHWDGIDFTIARAKILVVQYILTMGHYDYAINWRFHQDGRICGEGKMTGLVGTHLLHETTKGTKYSSTVAEQVMAPYHQHLFSARIDPMIDGESNSVATVDVVPVSTFTDPDADPYGIGFKTRRTTLRNEFEGMSDGSLESDRTWLIYNPNSINPINNEPVGWKLVSQNKPLLLAIPGSEPFRRGRFVTHDIWVTRYHEKEIYPAGVYTGRPLKEAETDGLPRFIRNNETIQNKDIVLWHTFGLTHVPCVEQHPIMSLESVGFTLKPANFFTAYPGLDVPAPS